MSGVGDSGAARPKRLYMLSEEEKNKRRRTPVGPHKDFHFSSEYGEDPFDGSELRSDII